MSHDAHSLGLVILRGLKHMIRLLEEWLKIWEKIVLRLAHG